MANWELKSPADLGLVDQSELIKKLRIDSGQRDASGESHRWMWVLAIVTGLLIATGATAYYAVGGPRLEVSAVTATVPSAGGADTAVLQATGYVTARREATVSAQITGTLTDVMIEEGDHVKAGQVLAHLDSTAQKAALEQAEAQSRAAQATLIQYQTQLEQSRRDLLRQQGLIERKLTSQQALEDAQTLVDTGVAQVEAQRKQVDLGEAGVRAAKVQFDYATIRAPFTGVVIAKAAQVGEIVSPFSAGGGFTRTGVGTIVDMDSLEVEVDVNEAYLNRVTPLQPAQAVLDAYPNWTIPAHVIAIIPTADRGKATVKVRVALEVKDPRVLPDMGVRVSFFEKAHAAGTPAPSGVLVPAAAIVQRAGRSVVFEIDGDRARARAVTAGAVFGDLQLVSGISAGAQVVKQPQPELADGAKISLSKQP
jgi:RND family efflux transporter MFP subunit